MKVAIVGLGMAVTPHAKSLLDLKERAQVAYAYSPSAERRQKFAEKFDFPLTDRLETILGDRSVDAVLILTPPNTHLELVERCAGPAIEFHERPGVDLSPELRRPRPGEGTVRAANRQRHARGRHSRAHLLGRQRVRHGSVP